MTSLPSLSVIIPYFNSDKTIRRCLSSIHTSMQRYNRLEESPPQIEVLVGIDGPENGDKDLLTEIANTFDFRTRVVTLPKTGIAGTRNSLVAKATSDFITFLDADDELSVGRLLPGNFISGSIVIGEQSIQVAAGAQKPSGLGVRSQPNGASKPGHFYFMSMVLQRELFRKLGGLAEEFSRGDDWDFVVRARRAGIPIVWVNEIHTVRHINGRNASLDHLPVSRDYFAAIRSRLNNP